MPVGSLAVVALALYRKYRPAKFAEVVGQEHVTEPLRTALAAGRINHAYLFSGPRGCGKTSSARILARSLNCEQGPTPEPCGVCASCVSLAPGGPGNIDVTELDAASHGGVDDTRELRDRAFFAPAESRYRVFIVDEAHMITTQGFNALLKIVEEPPEHLVFVFATTEPDKVLTTIRSRTHHYPFRLIPPGTLRKLMERICAEEGAVVAPAVYPLVIRAGGGSARDSLSVLDQLLAGAGPEGVTYERAVALLGVTDVSLIDDMVDALAAGDRAAVFETVDRMVEAGHDPRRFAADLLQRLRDLTLLQAVPEAPARGLVDAADDEIVRMIEQADRLSAGTLARYGEIVHSGLIEMRGATAPRLLLELLCARMLLPAATVAEPGLLERLERLERRNAIAATPLPAGETVAEPPAEQGSGGSRRTFARPSNRPGAGAQGGGAQEGGAQQSDSRTGTGGRDGAAEGRSDRDAPDASPPRGGGMAAGDRADRESASAGRPVDGPGGAEATSPAGGRAGDRPGGQGDPDAGARQGVAAVAGAGSSPADRTSAGAGATEAAAATRAGATAETGAAGTESAAGTRASAGTRAEAGNRDTAGTESAPAAARAAAPSTGTAAASTTDGTRTTTAAPTAAAPAAGRSGVRSRRDRRSAPRRASRADAQPCCRRRRARRPDRPGRAAHSAGSHQPGARTRPRRRRPAPGLAGDPGRGEGAQEAHGGAAGECHRACGRRGHPGAQHRHRPAGPVAVRAEQHRGDRRVAARGARRALADPLRARRARDRRPRRTGPQRRLRTADEQPAPTPALPPATDTALHRAGRRGAAAAGTAR